MDYILSGDPKEVDKVIRENAIRVNRGVIRFTPVATGAAADDKYIEPVDTKDVPAADDTQIAPAKKASKRTKPQE